MMRFLIPLSIVLGTAAGADPAVIEDVTAEKHPYGWQFEVTLRHEDTGWSDYADGWRIVDPDSGEVYGTRRLRHPHVGDQPVTSRLSGVAIPEDVVYVLIEESTRAGGWSEIPPYWLRQLKELGDAARPLWLETRYFALKHTDICTEMSFPCRALNGAEIGLLGCIHRNDGSYTMLVQCPFR